MSAQRWQYLVVAAKPNQRWNRANSRNWPSSAPACTQPIRK